MFVSAIIAAGGRGERFGGAVPKQLLEVGGRSVLERSLEPFLGCELIDEVVVVVPPELAGCPPVDVARARKPVRVVPGGARRQDSVANGFAAIDPRAEIIVVHDAARPFVDAPLIGRVVEAAAEHGAAIAAIRARDTVKLVRPADAEVIAGGVAGTAPAAVGETVPRDRVFLAQTPQAFRRRVLADALALGGQGVEATDEAALAELAGHLVRLVEGDPRNIKITTPEDLDYAERGLLVDRADRDAPAYRVGVGYDLHRLVPGRPLVLGGVRIDYPLGLAGHSDADVVAHAVTDAILGAAAQGDIGAHFPDSDERWRGAASLDLLRRSAARVREAGFTIENLDVVVVAERPRIAPHAQAMAAGLAAAAGVAASCVSVKGKTNEGLGETGRGEAIAAHAVALLARARRVSDP